MSTRPDRFKRERVFEEFRHEGRIRWGFLQVLGQKYIKMTPGIVVKRGGQRHAALDLLYIYQPLLTRPLSGKEGGGGEMT